MFEPKIKDDPPQFVRNDGGPQGVDIEIAGIILHVVNVENEFVGLSLSDHSEPFRMRRVSVELRDVAALTQLRDFLNCQISRMTP